MCRNLGSVPKRWREQCLRLHSLYVDGNPQLDEISLVLTMCTLPSLKVLSIVDCTQMASSVVREAMNDGVSVRKQKGFSECRIIGP